MAAPGPRRLVDRACGADTRAGSLPGLLVPHGEPRGVVTGNRPGRQVGENRDETMTLPSRAGPAPAGAASSTSGARLGKRASRLSGGSFFRLLARARGPGRGFSLTRTCYIRKLEKAGFLRRDRLEPRMVEHTAAWAGARATAIVAPKSVGSSSD